MTEQRTEKTSQAMDTPSPSGVSVAAPPKQVTTAGQVLFNLTTYAGVTWILNEIISGGVLTAIKPAVDGKKAGAWNHTFEKTVDWFHTKANPLKISRDWVKYPLTIVALTSGGNALVPVVKWLEDRKGALVRKADYLIHGDKAKTDPELVAAHKKMDETPKQSWGSLIFGRSLVMVAAVAMDLFMGDDKLPNGKPSPSTQLLKNTFMEKYSNMSRMGTTISRDILSRLHPDKAKREIISSFRKMPIGADGKIPKIHPSEGKAMALMGGTYGFVLVFSALMSVLFFTSSKFFAATRDKKEHAHDQENTPAPMAGLTTALPSTDQSFQQAPSAKVSNVSDRSTLGGLQAARAV